MADGFGFQPQDDGRRVDAPPVAFEDRRPSRQRAEQEEVEALRHQEEVAQGRQHHTGAEADGRQDRTGPRLIRTLVRFKCSFLYICDVRQIYFMH